MMGSILSPNSSDSKIKGEDSTLIEMNQEIPEEDRRAEDLLKIKECPSCPTDPNAYQFVKTFRELQSQKEHFYVELHNEVIQWRLMFQRGISNKFENNKKVNLLIREFVKIHERLDEFLEKERQNLEKILPKQKSASNNNNKSGGQKELKKEALIQKEKESLELTPEAMQRLMCFQQCNDQHIRVLTQVLSDIEDCKTFVRSTESTKSTADDCSTKPSGDPSIRPITITVSTDSEEVLSSAETH